jgi:hypothetical protein
VISGEGDVTRIPVFHMSSFSRSGETLLLRCLAAHPDIEVVHQIAAHDTAEDTALFEHLAARAEPWIERDDPHVAHRRLGPRSVLLLKNAVWIHPHPRAGFTLVRNPFSVVRSAYRDRPKPERLAHQVAQQTRWAKGIDPLLVPAMEMEPTLATFTLLYVRKMLHDRDEGLPFLRYEDFVRRPDLWLGRILAHLGLPWDDRVLRSHELYPEGARGHGGIRLSEPVHEGSRSRYRSMDPAHLSLVYGIAREALDRYGYVWDGGRVRRRRVEGMLPAVAKAGAEAARPH